MDQQQSRKIIEMNRVEARRRLLHNKDICNFESVPAFIIIFFFGEGTYKARLIVTTFGFVNGLSPVQLFSLIRWRLFQISHQRAILKLYEWLKNPTHGRRYYSYNVVKKAVIFCNGDVRKYGQRIV